MSSGAGRKNKCREVFTYLLFNYRKIEVERSLGSYLLLCQRYFSLRVRSCALGFISVTLLYEVHEDTVSHRDWSAYLDCTCLLLHNLNILLRRAFLQ